MRLALQREMGIEQPRLLSEAERDEIAGELAQATPADRPAIIAGLRARYGPQANMLAAELAGEVDANTALLIAHADMPQLPRLLANGMEKAKKDGPAKLTLANPEALNDLPALPLVGTGVPGSYKLDIPNLKSGWTYRAPGGAALFYNGEILVPSTVEIAPVASPTGTFGAPGPAPVEIEPLAPPMASRDLPALAPDVNPHAEEAAEAGDPPVVLEAEHTSLPTGKEEGEGTLSHETNGVDEASRENATERPNDFHPGTEQRDKDQMPVAADRQGPPHGEVSSDQPESGPQSAPGTNSYTNEKRADKSDDRELEDPTPSIENTKNETVIDWEPLQSFVTKGKTFETNGPVKIELNSMSLGLDGLRYTVNWHPLDKNGKRQTIVRSQDYRPPEYGGNLLTGVPSETIIEPPYDNPYGFEVTVSVPPQASYNDNSAGPYLNIYLSK
ncbi:MAG: hypothetical protein OEZ03_09050 [Alphaproteobacteria bacterium]|nr:hypothetical protein [Alphaproteobacteria bacterium]